MTMIKQWLMAMCLFFMTGMCMAQNLGEVKTGFVNEMQNKGYITQGQATQIKQEMISKEDFNKQVAPSVEIAKGDDTVQKTISTQSLLSFSNFLIVSGIFVLIAFFWKSIKNLIIQVPAIIYQALFLGVSVAATIYPEKFSSSYSFYVVLAASLMNLMIIGWMAVTYKEIAEKIVAKFAFLAKIGLRAETVMCMWLMVYFGFFAITQESKLFGFFAAVAFSGIFSFVIISFPGAVGLGQTRNIPNALIFSHLIAFAIFIVMGVNGIASEYTKYFATGIQYYCTLAIGITLLIESSFWSGKNKATYSMGLIVVTLLANFFGAMFNLTASAAIMNVLMVVWIIEWVGYVSFSVGALGGLLFSGLTLVGMGVLIDKYASTLLTALSSAM